MDIDREIRQIVSQSYEKAKTILVENEEALRAIAESLLERETIDGSEIDTIINVLSEGQVPGETPQTPTAVEPESLASATPSSTSPERDDSDEERSADEGEEVIPPRPAGPTEAPA